MSKKSGVLDKEVLGLWICISTIMDQVKAMRILDEDLGKEILGFLEELQQKENEKQDLLTCVDKIKKAIETRGDGSILFKKIKDMIEGLEAKREGK